MLRWMAWAWSPAVSATRSRRLLPALLLQLPHHQAAEQQAGEEHDQRHHRQAARTPGGGIAATALLGAGAAAVIVLRRRKLGHPEAACGGKTSSVARARPPLPVSPQLSHQNGSPT
jgi:hypothetical protein